MFIFVSDFGERDPGPRSQNGAESDVAALPHKTHALHPLLRGHQVGHPRRSRMSVGSRFGIDLLGTSSFLRLPWR